MRRKDREGYVAVYATPAPILLNTISLNQKMDSLISQAAENVLSQMLDK